MSELTGEYYRHYAGLKDEFEIEPIYERHAELFGVARSHELRDALALATPAAASERRRLTMLLDFAVEGYLGQATKHAEAELARREASITLELGGERLGFRESAVVQANEPDAGARAPRSRQRGCGDRRAAESAAPRADRDASMRSPASSATRATASCAPSARGSTWRRCTRRRRTSALVTRVELPGA